MRTLLTLLAGPTVTRAYRTTRGWQTTRETGQAYLRGLAHGAVATVAAAVLLVGLG